MTRPHIEQLVHVARELASVPHGQKAPVYERYARQYDCTIKTLHQWLNEASQQRGQRKPRADKGNSSLTLDEARLISALVIESAKQTGKRLYTVAQAVDVLRSNNKIKAETINPSTGECAPLSSGAIERALAAYGLHPDQLRRPTPAQQLRSAHPNHVWQIDPSLCVLYYLPKDAGLTVMESDKFYKNKPDNAAQVEKQRVWRYVITDHASGWCYVEYVFGAESGENLSTVFINAMQYRGIHDPVHGVPVMTMLDPGSANTGAIFKNLCYALGVRVQINKPGNPRAKGQVENMNNIVERQFEGGLKFVRINTLDELNHQAHRWMRIFNATSIHRRHGMSRYAAWMRISPDQLIKAPDVETCRALTNERIETRKVDAHMQVSWRGSKYDCGHIPALNNGDTIEVARNPWKIDTLRVIRQDNDGNTLFFEAEKIQVNEYGFNTDAALIGEEYKSHADTPVVQAQKLIEQIATETSTAAEAEGKRKAKAIPFGGNIDPYKPVTDAEGNQPSWIEKRGQASPLASPTTHLRPFTWVEAAKQLRAALGQQWTADSFAELKQRYPEGVPQDAMPELIAHFSGKDQATSTSKPKPTLRVIGGH